MWGKWVFFFFKRNKREQERERERRGYMEMHRGWIGKKRWRGNVKIWKDQEEPKQRRAALRKGLEHLLVPCSCYSTKVSWEGGDPWI